MGEKRRTAGREPAFVPVLLCEAALRCEARASRNYGGRARHRLADGGQAGERAKSHGTWNLELGTWNCRCTAGGAEPVGAIVSQHTRPQGAEESPGIVLQRNSVLCAVGLLTHRAKSGVLGRARGSCAAGRETRRAKLRCSNRRAFVGPGTSFAPPGRKRGKKTRPLFPHPLSTGSSSGRFAAAPLHPRLHSAAPLGLPPVDACHGRSLPPPPSTGGRTGPQGSVRQ